MTPLVIRKPTVKLELIIPASHADKVEIFLYGTAIYKTYGELCGNKVTVRREINSVREY